MLTVNFSSITHKFFIMDNRIGIDGKPKGQVPGTPYFAKMRDAHIAMMGLKDIKNLYTLSERDYAKLLSNR